MEKITSLRQAAEFMCTPESKARYTEGEYPWEEQSSQIKKLLNDATTSEFNNIARFVQYGLGYDYSPSKIDVSTTFSAETFIEVFGKMPIVQLYTVEITCYRQFDQPAPHPLTSFRKGYNANMPIIFLDYLVLCITQRAAASYVKEILRAVSHHLLTPKRRKVTKKQLETHLAIIKAVSARFPKIQMDYEDYEGLPLSISFHEFAEAFNFHFFLDDGYMLKFYKKHLSPEY